jgi:anthranilate phosphoribosyltransferase
VPAGGDPEENARWLVDLLANRVQDPTRDLVLLNAAAALHVAGRAGDLREGRALADAALCDGRAAALLDRLREVTLRL